MATALLGSTPPGSRITLLDPGCGVGGLLQAALEVAARRGLRLEAHGVECDRPRAARARAALASGDWARHARATVHEADFLLARPPAPAFDAVIANPPWVALRQLSHAMRRQLQSRWGGHGDLATCFVDRILDLLAPGGRVCLIVPNKILVTEYARALRRRCLAELTIEELWDFSEADLFPGFATYPVVLVARREAPRAGHRVQVLDAHGRRREAPRQADLVGLPGDVIPLGMPPGSFESLATLLRGGETLGSRYRFACGTAVTGFGRAVGRGRGRIVLSGDVGAFHIRRRRRFSPERVPLPLRTARRQQVPKIVIPGMLRSLRAAFDPRGDYLGRVYFAPWEAPPTRKPAAAEAERCLLLAILNSRLFDLIYRGLYGGTSQAGGYLRVNGPYLRSLPFPAGERPPQRLVEWVQSMENRPSPELWRRIDTAVEAWCGLEAASRALLPPRTNLHDLATTCT